MQEVEILSIILSPPLPSVSRRNFKDLLGHTQQFVAQQWIKYRRELSSIICKNLQLAYVILFLLCLSLYFRCLTFRLMDTCIKPRRFFF